MTDRAIRKSIVDVGRRLYARGLVASFDGNVSVRTDDGRVWTTPTGVPKGRLRPRDLVCTDLEGRVLRGRRAPSSEIRMHLRVYRENPEARAAVHAHPPSATAFAAAGLPLDRPVLTEMAAVLGTVPVAPYAAPGTEAVGDSVAPFCRTHRAVLLANHGALSWGASLEEAYGRMESLESYATVLLHLARLGGGRDLPEGTAP